MVLRQNNQLSADNEKLSKMFEVQKIETECLREKCQGIDELQYKFNDERKEL